MNEIQRAVGDKLLRIGATGPIVEMVQLGLRSIGYALRGTGYYGPATDVAVSTFQRRAGLVTDGVFGPLSAKALDLAIAAKADNAGVEPTKTLAPLAEVGRPLWLEAGIKLIGTREGAGSADNQTLIDWAKGEGGDIAKTYTHDEIPWCALFINHIFTHVGLKGTETLWALDWNGDRMERRLGRRWPGVRLSGPAVGAIAPMLRKGGGHVIAVTGRDQHGNVMGLGGNQSNQVSNIPFPLSRLNEGFWWPEGVPMPAQIGIKNLPIVRSDGRVSTKES